MQIEYITLMIEYPEGMNVKGIREGIANGLSMFNIGELKVTVLDPLEDR